MALIKCPECKKKVSDQCENCPQCGYPIKSDSQIEDLGNQNNEVVDESNYTIKKPFYKKVWVWIVASIVLVALILGSIFLLNGGTEPLLDEDGNPVFVELTNEVYTNVENYLGYYVNIKGEVFQTMSDDGNVKGIQVWLDPDTCEQNMMIYYNTDVEIKKGDYIICSGYIDSIREYSNAFGAKLYAPVVISEDLKKSTYINVMSPTIDSIVLENLKTEKYGYSFSIDKIEFAEKETRVYATATNNGKALLYVGDSIIVQDGKQYNSTTNYDADYEEIPYEVVKGVSCSGIIVFPAMSASDFEFTIGIHSDEEDEKLGEFVVLIGKEKSEIKTSWPADKPVPSAVGTYYCISTEWKEILYVYSDGTLYYEAHFTSEYPSYSALYSEPFTYTMTGTWTQKGNLVTYNVYESDGTALNNPFSHYVYENGFDFLGDFFTRQ